MTAFLIVAAVLISAALLFILPTLLRKDLGGDQQVLRDAINLAVLRDQMRELDADLAAGTINGAAYESAKHELEKRVLEDVRLNTPTASVAKRKPWVGTLIGLSIPAVAISLYFMLGSPAGLNPAQVAAPDDPAHQVTEAQIATMVAGLAQRLKNEPDNVEGWVMLARSYSALGRFSEAVVAYEHLVKLNPENAGILADYADTLAMTLGKSLQGEPEKLIQRALVADPKNVKALFLAGSAAYDRQDYRSAVSQWKKILLLVPPDSEMARSAMGNISDAQSRVGEPATLPTLSTAAPVMSVAPAPTAEMSKVEGRVELDPALRSKVSDTDTVFIFAKAAQGPKFPLAVLRKQVKDLPLNFTLDDSMSMMPDAKLSNFPLVIIGARISKTGNATPGTGDLEGASEPVQPGSKDLIIKINRTHQ
jgi:cytochrome c-type biogenesis protein CcmH